MKDRIHLPKLFYAIESKYPDWPWTDRRAVGTDLDKAWFKDEPVYRFQYKNTVYEISREKAQYIGRRFTVPNGVCPHLIPLAEMDRVIDLAPAIPAFPREPKAEAKQSQLF